MRLGGERRKAQRMTVDQVVTTLIQMDENLRAISDEKDGHVVRLDEEKRLLEARISVARNEKARAERISGNLQKLLA